MSAKHSVSVLVCFALLAAVPVFRAEAARFREHSANYKTAPGTATPVAATCLGRPGTEWLAGVAFHPDGSLVAAGGNAYCRVEVHPDRIIIRGYGVESNRELRLGVRQEGKEVADGAGAP
ncbi:MAG: hypothetical protein FJ224_03115 [Lentisphaerae bacterium]|nr:hypothetical protein [Lentisphaerota bacterium]